MNKASDSTTKEKTKTSSNSVAENTKQDSKVSVSFKTVLLDFLRGIPVGVANIIPGVSGGTIAVMLGIYDKLIGSISNIRKKFLSSIVYLVPILLGAGVGILAFNYLLQDVLLKYYHMQTNMFFIGLVLGSLPMILRTSGIKKASPGSVIPFIVATAAMVLISVFFKGGTDAGQAGFELTAVSGIMLVISGIVAAVSMLLPGISGSMMLMVLGYYYIVTGALKSFDLVILLLFGIGVLIGLLGGAKIIDICLQKFRIPTYSAIIGLVIGSLYQLFAESGFAFDINGLFAVIALVLGAAIALVSGSRWLADKVSKSQKSAEHTAE